MSQSTTETTPAKTKPVKSLKMAKPVTAKSASIKKPDIILNMMSRAKGAAIEQLQEATGWQPHSIRAVISILRKKGVAISRSQAKDGAMLYHAKKA